MKKKKKFTQTRGGITIKRENTSQRGKKKKKKSDLEYRSEGRNEKKAQKSQETK